MHHLARMRAPNIIGAAVFAVILVLAMWPFTSIETVDPRADRGNYVGEYEENKVFGVVTVWPQGPGEPCSFRVLGWGIGRDGMQSWERRPGTPYIWVRGWMACDEKVRQEISLNSSVTFIFSTSRGEVAQCKLRLFDTLTSSYRPARNGARFWTRCPQPTWHSERYEVVEVTLDNVQLTGPFPPGPAKLLY